jgi:DNA-binding response OmpR family regulator
MAAILVIDDDPEIRDIMVETLRAKRHTVAAASNGRDGVQLCWAHPPDLVITDLLMPEKEGLETIQEIRSKRPDLKILAISGAPEGWKTLEMARKLGAQRTLRKPFLPDELLAEVEQLLSGREGPPQRS